jgi:type VI secretion system secreted protein VgrG
MADSTLGWYAFNPVTSQQTDFQVAAIDGTERLGGNYCFDVDLVSPNFDLDLAEFVGTSAALSMQPWNGSLRFFHGVVTAAEMVHTLAENKALYRMRLEPRLSMLRQTIFNLAYLDSVNGLALSDLLQQVLSRQGLELGQDYQLQLGAPITRRSFVMQYRETDLDFLTRWLEFEGAFYYFLQGDAQGQESIVFIDDISALPPNTLDLKYRPGGGISTDQYATSLTRFGEVRKAITQTVALLNYDYRHAQDLVEITSDVQSPSWGQIFTYGDDLRSNDQANSYAKLRAQALDVQAQIFRGQSFATGLTVGMTISVTDHPRSAFNGDFMVTQVRHRGTQAGFGVSAPDVAGVSSDQNYYVAEFEAIAAQTPFRLQLETPRPSVSGYLPAQIDSEDGQAAALDKYGRYKVQLLYDAAAHDTMKGSAWVRLAAPYQGPGQTGDTGIHFPLSLGTEVMLAFMDGDPDQPVIVGVLNNSLYPSTVNDANNTVNRIVSRLGNELHMDDTVQTPGIRMQTPNGNGAVLLGAFGGQFGRNSKSGQQNGR